MLSREELDAITVGSRVLAFDPALYRDDESTPINYSVRPATVLRRYGILRRVGQYGEKYGPYPDVVDLRFDHRPERESHGHFTNYLKGVWHEEPQMEDAK